MVDRREGYITGVNGNMVTAAVETFVIQNEVAFVVSGGDRLKAEVIRVRGKSVQLQVYESTAGLKVGDRVEFTEELLSVELGPGLLGKIFDGLQNPLPQLAEKCGFFLKRGVYLRALPDEWEWDFSPAAAPGAHLPPGGVLGAVQENMFRHAVFMPFAFNGTAEVVSIAPAGRYRLNQSIARVRDESGREHEVFMKQSWPVKVPIGAYVEKRRPTHPLVTKMRIIDSFFPVARGGTYCIPGPFGAGKTVLQQLTSRHAEIDVVVIAACGERAGEVVETLKTFPLLSDPRTGRPLSDRTVIICNTSSMPVAARESSVYTAATIAEYYRQMGLHVLLLADSTSRWAQAMREMSGRLEEIPGEEAFPAYLESRIASFYERAGEVLLHDGSVGSVTIGGTVSPAGGNFEEPVTQATLKVVGAFHGLSRERSDARRYPAIDPLISWSKYAGIIPAERMARMHEALRRSHDVAQMMKVVGEEGTSQKDFVDYLKGEFLDFVYLQQNAFDAVDESTPRERQAFMVEALLAVVEAEFVFGGNDEARLFFQKLRQQVRSLNSAQWQSESFRQLQAEMAALVAGKQEIHA